MSYQPVGPRQEAEHQAEVRNFDQFTTIDWILEEKSQRNSGARDVGYSGRWRRYLEEVWHRGQAFFTLTAIGVTVGCIAGFIQVLTETLVNWKTGYCARNWLLNKSFCCQRIAEDTRKFLVIEGAQCVEERLWVPWSNSVLAYFTFITLSVAFAMLSALMVKCLAPMATGSGISEIKVHVSGFQYKKEFFSLTTLAVKSVALPLAISSGLSVGKEGPSVHYATCCGFLIVQFLLRNTLKYAEQAEYLVASSAAGVAVAFGAPIGGVLFGLEEMSSSPHFNLSTLWKSFYVALSAVSTLQYLDPFRNGKIVLFEVKYDRDWHVEEIPIFILLGIFGGLYGHYIGNLNIWFVTFRRNYLSKWPLREVFVLALATTCLSYFNEFLKLDMTESMSLLFHECVEEKSGMNFEHRLCQLDGKFSFLSFLTLYCSLMFATVVRALGVVVSYGARVPAGIFVPSMAVGATFGRSISVLVENFITGPHVITPGTYAFLGAAAALSGITNMTLTVVVIMFELTGAFIYIIPTMIVVAITRIVYSSFSKEGGIAEKMIMVNGFPFMECPQEHRDFLDEYCAADISTTDVVTIKESMHLSDLESLLEEVGNSYKGFPIIRNDDENEQEKRCIGYVTLQHIRSQLGMYTNDNTARNTVVDFTKKFLPDDENLIQFSDLVNYTPFTVDKSLSLSLLYQMFHKLGCKVVIVEDAGFLVGIITKKDFLRFQRTKRTELYGSINTFDEQSAERLWNLIMRVIRKLRSKQL
ncbi:AEL071Cp [Eremothecium gossypii ATCC 10895]|uniref:Chloride channel protein n=1 Tax=Eremothecium gossypii (strain ATCC 10895 / CBS 109.51 / FGSC 9923 / NRRL Y-1056) TaxID=284811 RepID=Q757T3_EREGS|nr:AEL071Cp [Eremothecium gossypii ATCC 10895]AAS52614.2 AEL071Cp [Eremothecium gossypii ATCC 10895]AEY96917.1 FAEL071Cp [Eremothecium gossypii FDAG1]